MAVNDLIVQRARELIGVPWVHCGRNPELGLDCAGLAIEVLRSIGIHVDAPEQYGRHASPEAMQSVIDHYCDSVRRSMLPGDLLFMSFRHVPRHVGIYIGGGEMIHAHEGKGVVVQQINPFWRNRIVGVYRLKPEFTQ